MLNEILNYHRYVIQILLLAVMFNALLPYVLKSNPKKMIFISRIGYFFFWAMWAIVLFSGMMAFMFSGRDANTNFWLMVISIVIIGVLEGYRSVVSKKSWANGNLKLRHAFIILLMEAIVILITYFIVAYS